MTLFASMALTLTVFASNDGTTAIQSGRCKPSSVTWHATKVTGEHMGTVNLANGYMSVTDGNLTSANVIVDMQTIACTDLANGVTSLSVTSTAMTSSTCQNTNELVHTPQHDIIEKGFRRRDAYRDRRVHHPWHHQERDI